MGRRKFRPRIGAGPILFFCVFCILGTIAGLWINRQLYLLESNHAGPESGRDQR